MNNDEFWDVIEQVKVSEEPEELLKTELEKLPPENIATFQNIFDSLFDDAYRWDLWGAAYLIGGGCSDDGFIDFRYGLISKGREVYERAIENPDTLAGLGEGQEIENEMFGYVAQEVYEEKTGNEIQRAMSKYSNPQGEQWDFDDEDENLKRLPNLMKAYW